MRKKYYVKGKNIVSSSENGMRVFLTHIFIAANAGVIVLLFLFLSMPQYASQQAVSGTNFSNGISEVQGVSNEITSIPTVNPLPTVEPTPSVQQSSLRIEPSPTPRVFKKKSFRIAVYGDSMIDTMGELLEYLDHSLKKKYPELTFSLYNYGVGAENVEMGLNRFYNDFNYQTRRYSPLPNINADIIILGSFAYNPFFPYDRNNHWLTLTKLVQTAQSTKSKVYMLAEIAPLKDGFGKGPNGVNWSDEAAFGQVTKIVEQLENVIGLSKTLNVPLINVYEKSLIKGEKYGEKNYVNPSDGIHPSVEGHELTADIIVDTLEFE